MEVSLQLQEVMSELKEMGNPQTAKIYAKHGVDGEIYGVKVADLKKIVKKVKKDHDLALQLFDTKNSDAMYLAGLIADPKVATVDELDQWAKDARWYMISEYTVAWVAAESPHGWELGLKWIESDQDHIAAAGWNTLSSVVSMRADEDLDLEKLTELLDRVEKTVHQCSNRTRYTMNGFVISMGAYVLPLQEKALKVGQTIGKVSVDMGGTACKVPLAVPYIQKIIDKGRAGKKKKKVRC